jgi:hypothetical protein
MIHNYSSNPKHNHLGNASCSAHNNLLTTELNTKTQTRPLNPPQGDFRKIKLLKSPCGATPGSTRRGGLGGEPRHKSQLLKSSFPISQPDYRLHRRALSLD